MPSEIVKDPCYGISGFLQNDKWTDSLPSCRLSGVGTSTNQLYKKDGTCYSEHENEDKSFHFCLDAENGIYLYGVFDGHDGSKVAHFMSQRMPAELSFEQLAEKVSIDEIKQILYDAFLSVENSFLESIDPKIAERSQLLEKIPEGKQLETAMKDPSIFNTLKELEQEIHGGTTAVVSLLHKGHLYVGNVGNSRALLCKKDKSGVLRVRQLSTDHTTSNEDELERLKSINLDISKLGGGKLGNLEITRCIGNYFLKGGYKEFDILSSATSEPVIAEPYITTMTIDDSCSFLLLMSDGLYRSYQEATGSHQVNKDIAQMVVEQFVEQPTLTSVSQTVVDKVVRMHHDKFLTTQSDISCRDDITLIVRNFTFPMKQAFSVPSPIPPSGLRRNCWMTDESDILLRELTSRECSSTTEPSSFRDDLFGSTLLSSTAFSSSKEQSSNYPTESSTESSEGASNLTQYSLDLEGRIRPYVNFDQYNSAIDEAISNGLIPESEIHLYK